jgi:septal ring factor EnvC (AmiA/AmiB activator)
MQVASVQQELLQLRHDAAAASRERRQLQQHVSELEAQRSSTGAAMLQLHQQLADVQEQLAQDRATMATMLRQHQQQKQQLEEVSGEGTATVAAAAFKQLGLYSTAGSAA